MVSRMNSPLILNGSGSSRALSAAAIGFTRRLSRILGLYFFRYGINDLVDSLNAQCLVELAV